MFICKIQCRNREVVGNCCDSWITVSGSCNKESGPVADPGFGAAGGQPKGWELEAFPTFPCKQTMTTKNCA